jgi:hypothetical protein
MEFVKLQKDYSFSDTVVSNTTKFIGSKNFREKLKAKYFIKPWYFI